MRVFVAGASGVIGRPLLPRLVAAGHEVTGMTRRAERAEEIRAVGATAVVCDVFDAAALTAALAAAKPEAVIHALTALPHRFNPKSDYLAPTNEIRVTGTRNLLAAAQAAGARRVLAESIAFLYRPEGSWVKDEEAPAFTDAPGIFGPAYGAALDLERQVLGTAGIEGLVLRCGWLYGPGTFYDRDGSQAEDVRKRRLPIVGAAGGTFSFVHADDVATAFLAALERGAPGVYNVVDDEPARVSEWLPVAAAGAGAKPPRHLPAWLGRLAAGEAGMSMMTQIRGCSNAKAKAELGWEPVWPTWRDGFRHGLDRAYPAGQGG
jgi:2-alkyl-3-oxoalkanoate reductase